MHRLRPLLPGQRKALFGRMAPLSTFSAKIELGYAVGLYSEPFHTNLNMIREVRNRFAHSFNALSFNHPDIGKIIENARRHRLLTGDLSTNRNEFMAAFALVGAFLLAMRFQNIQLPSLGQTHVDTFRMMGRALDAGLSAMRSKRGTPPKGPPPESGDPKL